MAKGKKVSQADRDRMVELYLGGMSADKAAKELGRTYTTCYFALKAKGIKLRNRLVPQKDKDKIAKLYLSGMNRCAISKQIGYSYDTCDRVLKGRGIQIRDEMIDADKIVELYLSGLSGPEIFKTLGCSTSSCYRLMKQLNLQVRPPWRVYSINEHFFDKIDTEAKAYILGFISSDGAIVGTYLRIAVQKQDANHLQKFLDCMDSNYKIFHYKATIKKYVGKEYDYARINIGSIKLVTALKKLGVGERKSLTIKPYIKMKKSLLRHYLRGIFDGDGSICYSNGKWAMSLTGSRYIVNWFDKFIKQYVDTNVKVFVRGNISVVSYSQHKVPKIAKLLYGNSTIYLDRKKQLADKAIKQKFVRNEYKFKRKG